MAVEGRFCTFGTIFHGSVNKLTNTCSNNEKLKKLFICVFYYAAPALRPSDHTSVRSKYPAYQTILQGINAS